MRYKSHVLHEVQVSGETSNMIDIGQAKVEFGRYLNDTDYAHESMVCFIGQDLVSEFFGSIDPIDKDITVKRHPLPGDRRGGPHRDNVWPEPGQVRPNSPHYLPQGLPGAPEHRRRIFRPGMLSR